jgi:probable HAF family extracellular repeat protein
MKTAEKPPTRFRVVDLGPPQAAAGLNNGRQLVGRQVEEATGTRAVLRDGTQTRNLGTLGGTFSAARGINNLGVIVGDSLTVGEEAHHGFVYLNGAMYDLNDLLGPLHQACEILHAIAINDRNEIVAVAAIDGRDRAVLLVPDLM